MLQSKVSSESYRDLMNGPIRDIKANPLQAYRDQLQAEHRHMTKSDAMADKYGLTAESSTKDTQ